MQAYLTTAEAAKLLGLTVKSVRKLVAVGRLAVHRLGPGERIIRFTEADLETYLESCRQWGPQSPAPSRPLASNRRDLRNASVKSSRRGGQAAGTPAPNQRLAAMPPSRTTPGKFQV